MSSYFVILLGWVLGMLLVITWQSARVHRSNKFEETFWKAAKIYTRKDTGPLIASLIIMLIIMFILPEIVANLATYNLNPNTKQFDAKYQGYIAVALRWLRTTSVLLGALAHIAAFAGLSKAVKYFTKKEEE